MKDPADDVYSWERHFIERFNYNPVLTKKESLKLVNDVSVYLSILCPQIEFLFGQGYCEAIPLENKINIYDWGKTTLTICHEMGHIYVLNYYKDELPHGEMFVLTVIDLYSKFLQIPKNYLLKTAAEWGLINAKYKKTDFDRPMIGDL